MNKIIFGALLTFPLISLGNDYNTPSIPVAKSEMTGVLSESTWRQVKDKNIYFGHQSVGNNILQGITDLKIKYPWLSININHISNIQTNPNIQIIHSLVGNNGNPLSKNNNFKNTVEGNLKGKIDIAMFKYCYVDFNENSDAHNIFDEYKKTIESIKELNPNITIIHITVPLTSNQSGIKALIKTVFGKPVGGALENVIRNNYNDLIKQEYASDRLVFDLAKLESTNLDGNSNLFKYNDKYYRHLVSEFTDDDQHLNKYGRRYIAEQFLLFLANIESN